jgi:hypothetical protein
VRCIGGGSRRKKTTYRKQKTRKKHTPGARDADVSRANGVFVDPIPRKNKDLIFSKKQKQK